MNIQNERVILESIFRLNDDEIQYDFLDSGKAKSFTAYARDYAGIRSVEFSKDFDEFLRPLLILNPTLVKKLVHLTWAVSDGASVIFPIEIM